MAFPFLKAFSFIYIKSLKMFEMKNGKTVWIQITCIIAQFDDIKVHFCNKMNQRLVPDGLVG